MRMQAIHATMQAPGSGEGTISIDERRRVTVALLERVFYFCSKFSRKLHKYLQKISLLYYVVP